MATLTSVLREEFSRLCRIEVAKQLDELRKSDVELRKEIGELRRQLKAVEKQRGVPVPLVRVKPVLSEGVSLESVERFKPTAKAVKQLRAKLGISQVEMAALLGVTSQSISNWERRDGDLSLRRATKVALLNLKAMGKRSALAQLMGEEDEAAE